MIGSLRHVRWMTCAADLMHKHSDGHGVLGYVKPWEVHVCPCMHMCVRCWSPVSPLAPGRALAFVCNACNVSVCICVYGLSGRRQRGTARGGQTQQVKEQGGWEVYWYWGGLACVCERQGSDQTRFAGRGGFKRRFSWQQLANQRSCLPPPPPKPSDLSGPISPLLSVSIIRNHLFLVGCGRSPSLLPSCPPAGPLLPWSPSLMSVNLEGCGTFTADTSPDKRRASVNMNHVNGRQQKWQPCHPPPNPSLVSSPAF